MVLWYHSLFNKGVINMSIVEVVIIVLMLLLLAILAFGTAFLVISTVLIKAYETERKKRELR